MSTAAFRLGYMSKIAELAKSAQNPQQPSWARNGTIKNTLGVRREDPRAVARENADAAARLDSAAERELDANEASMDDLMDFYGGDIPYSEIQAERERANERAHAVDNEMQSTLSSMTPEARSEYLSRKAKDVDGNDTGFTSFNSNRARAAVLNNHHRTNAATALATGADIDTSPNDTRIARAFQGADSARTAARDRQLAQESAERAQRWASNKTVKWSPGGQQASGTAVASAPAATPAATPAKNPRTIKVRYNAANGTYSREDGSTDPWTDAEKRSITRLHAQKNRTKPINWGADATAYLNSAGVKRPVATNVTANRNSVASAAQPVKPVTVRRRAPVG